MDDQSRGRRRPHHEMDPNDSRVQRSPEGPREKIQRGPSSSSSAPRDDSQPSTSRGSVGGGGGGAAAAAPSSSSSSGKSSQRGGDNRRRIDRFEVVHTRSADIVSKQGTDGQPIRLQTNYFKLLTKPQWQIYQYYVDFAPEIEVTRVRCGILSNLTNLIGDGYAFDGKQMFCLKKLSNEKTVVNTKSKNDTEYTITIKLVGTISITESRFLQVMNLILRRAMKGLKLELVGRNLFDPRGREQMREFDMEIWPGYETSIRQHEKDILLCAGLTHKVMRNETVYKILLDTSRNPQRHQDDFRAQVLGLVVLTEYNNKTYRIDEVDFSQSPRSTFNCKGRDVSFVEYYREKYHINIRDVNQPLLVSKNRVSAQKTNANEIVILIPELCRVTGITDHMRSNFKLMSAMSAITRMNPQRRIDRLQAFNNRLQSTPESIKVLNDWNMKLDSQLVELQGRVIQPQRIVFRTNRYTTDHRADWTRCFHNEQLLTTHRDGLSNWAAIATQRTMGDLRNLVRSLQNAGRNMGLMIQPPREVSIYDERTGTYVQAIDECARMDPRIILCLVPNPNEERYCAIKRRACIDRAVPTQVVTMKAAKSRGLMSIATKIAIQMNCKLGYTPWMVELPLERLMTVGFDIAKSTRDRSKAYCALVASMDLKSNATFYSTVAECNAHDLMANNLWIMLAKALRQYKHEHNFLPARILFYRDGVSSGSLKQLMDFEVKDIVEKLNAEYERSQAKPPLIAYIVVTKSVNTRFFNGRNNPPPGTVVDDVVTLPEAYDFYLVSQSVNQGTVSPTAYNVVYSNIKLTPDQIQKLTYKMCHLYYNWSGTTRVPAVCQYAKKLATLVGTNLNALPDNGLEKKFYYI